MNECLKGHLPRASDYGLNCFWICDNTTLTAALNALNQKNRKRTLISGSQLNKASIVSMRELAAMYVATTDGAYSCFSVKRAALMDMASENERRCNCKRAEGHGQWI